MRRRIFLALLMSVVLSGVCASAQEGARQQQQEVPPDRISLEEFKAMLADKKPVLILDVRFGIDRRIKGALHVPLDQVETRLAEFPRDREIVTYCSWPSEHTSARAAQILRDKGFKARALLGGFPGWVAAGGETEPAEEKTTPNAMPPQQNTDAQQEQHVIASPNPTIDDSKTPAAIGPKKVETTRIQPAATTSTQAPMKTTSKSKSKHKRTKPRSD